MQTFFRVVFFCFIFLLIPFESISAATNEIPIWKRSKFEQLKYAEAKLQEAELEIQSDPSKNQLNYLNSPLQRLGTIRTFVGDAFGAIESFDRWTALSNRIGTIQTGDLERLQEASALNAIETIVEEARSRQIVILNEAHQMPLHRAFAMRLASELRKIGYEYLACETLSEPLESGYVKQSTGYYSQEPVYGNFLRDAAKDGWKFVHYDDMAFDKTLSSEQNEILRETRQAENIVAATIKLNSKAKVFVYVGHGHGMKTHIDSTQTIFMAEYLQKLTQINPLSIDQTTLYEHSTAYFNHPLYLPALNLQTKNSLIGQQSAFVLKSTMAKYEVFGRYQDRVDMQVIHPSYKMDPQTHRYEWLSVLAHLSPSDIPDYLLPKVGRRVIYVYRLEEVTDAVPVDVVIVEIGRPIPKLMLPRGQFRFEFED